MRSVDLIVIHCTGTPNGDSLFRGKFQDAGFETPVDVIDREHKARGFRRNPAWRKLQNPQLAAIGYHFVIYTSGEVATGRHVDEVGAHARGHNESSLGVSLVGTDKFSASQWEALAALVQGLQKTYPHARVLGHRDLSPDLDGDGQIERNEWIKICPGFDAASWRRGGMSALPNHLLPAKT